MSESFRGIASDCFPSEADALLLQAVLAPDERRRRAWRQWRSEQIDRGAPAWLLSLAIGRQRDAAEPPDQPGDLDGQMGHCLAAALAALDAGGIETLLLKGAALAVASRDLWARPMSDVDLLVPTAQAGEAIEALLGTGWSRFGEPGEIETRWTHAAALISREGTLVDLHWHALADRRAPEDDGPLWAASRSARFRGRPCRLPSHDDLMLHALAHGLTWSLGRDCRWVIDAARLCTADLDAERLVARAQRSEVAPWVRTGLAYLNERLALPIPAVLDRLEGTFFQERAFRALTKSDARRSAGDAAVLVEHRYRAARRAGACGGGIAGRLEVVRRDWRVVRPGALASAGMSRVWRRIRGDAGRPAARPIPPRHGDRPPVAKS